MDPVVAKIAEQFRVVHGHLRDEVRELSVEELNWKPAPDTNSIAVLVVHTLGSERRCFASPRMYPASATGLPSFA